MIRYVIRRLLSTVVVMGVVAFAVFSLLYLTPGDPAAVIAGDIATDEDIRRIRASLGLDEPTLSLTLCTLVVAIVVAVPLGVVAAAKAGRWIDRAVMAFSVLGFSVPVFVIAYALILTFSVELDW